MNEQAVSTEKQTIAVDYDLPAKPEKVWRALTDPAILAQWLMPNDIRAEVGHRFTFQAPPMPEWDGMVYCEVLEVVPQSLLVYSWRGGDKKDGGGYELDSVVTWKLEPGEDGGTRLSLRHSGFDAKSFDFQILSQGWRGKVAAQLMRVLAE